MQCLQEDKQGEHAYQLADDDCLIVRKGLVRIGIIVQRIDHMNLNFVVKK